MDSVIAAWNFVVECWDSLYSWFNADHSPLSNLANIIQVSGPLLTLAALAGAILTRKYRKFDGPDQTKTVQTAEAEPAVKDESDGIEIAPLESAQPESAEHAESQSVPDLIADDSVLFDFHLLVSKRIAGELLAIRSPLPPKGLTFSTTVFLLFALSTCFLWIGLTGGTFAGLSVTCLVAIFLYNRLGHGSVVEIDIKRRRLWIVREFSGYGGGIWPPNAKLDITYDQASNQFVATVSIHDVPIAIGRHKRQDILKRRFARLMAYFSWLDGLKPGRQWHMSWG